MELLFEIMGREAELSRVSEAEVRRLAGEQMSSIEQPAAMVNDEQQDGTANTEERLYTLRSEAYELTNLLTTLRQDLPSSSGSIGPAGSGTHTVQRKSDREAEKLYKKAVKQAAIAIEKAREAGALTDSDTKILVALKDGTEVDISKLDDYEYDMWQNNRGLEGMDERQIQLMKADLAPEGTKVYDDSLKKGLPRGAIREIKEGYEQVIIPAPVLDRSKLPERIVLDDVLGVDERKAFAGTTSLNPMQSTVFDAAYCSRENLLICAPTGAGVSAMYLHIIMLIMLFDHGSFILGAYVAIPPEPTCMFHNLWAEKLRHCFMHSMWPVAKRYARIRFLSLCTMIGSLFCGSIRCY